MTIRELIACSLKMRPGEKGLELDIECEKRYKDGTIHREIYKLWKMTNELIEKDSNQRPNMAEVESKFNEVLNVPKQELYQYPTFPEIQPSILKE